MAFLPDANGVATARMSRVPGYRRGVIATLLFIAIGTMLGAGTAFVFDRTFWRIGPPIGFFLGAVLSPLFTICTWRKGLVAASIVAYVPTVVVAFVGAMLSTPVLVLMGIGLCPMMILLTRVLLGDMGIEDSRKCLYCGYDSRENTSPICPECGRSGETSTPTTRPIA